MDFVLFTFVNAHALRDVSGVASFITIISTFGKLNSDYVLCVNQTIPIKMKSWHKLPTAIKGCINLYTT